MRGVSEVIVLDQMPAAAIDAYEIGSLIEVVSRQPDSVAIVLKATVDPAGGFLEAAVGQRDVMTLDANQPPLDTRGFDPVNRDAGPTAGDNRSTAAADLRKLRRLAQLHSVSDVS